MTIEVKIIACNKSDLMTQLLHLSELAVAPASQPATLEQFSLQEMVEFLAKQGYAITPTDIVDEATVVNPDKKSRRKKAATVEEAAPASSEEEADTPAESSYTGDVEDLKSEVIAKCSQLMLDGRRDVVMALKKMFGRTLSDLPADRFPAIAEELERILNDGSSDE